MSTAEQIIATVVSEHKFWFSFEGYDKCTCGAEVHRDDHPAHVAAHVVAALTNAGKTIVELPEPVLSDPSELEPGDDPRMWVGTHERFWVSEHLVDAEFGMRYTPEQARKEAAALLAAARVAEGGEQP